MPTWCSARASSVARIASSSSATRWATGCSRSCRTSAPTSTSPTWRPATKCSAPTCCSACTWSPTASASSRRSPPKWPASAYGSTRCRSAITAASTGKARRSAGRTASPRSGRSCATACSSATSVWGSRRPSRTGRAGMTSGFGVIWRLTWATASSRSDTASAASPRICATTRASSPPMPIGNASSSCARVSGSIRTSSRSSSTGPIPISRRCAPSGSTPCCAPMPSSTSSMTTRRWRPLRAYWNPGDASCCASRRCTVSTARSTALPAPFAATIAPISPARCAATALRSKCCATSTSPARWVGTWGRASCGGAP